jgi:hypothetical protein
MPTWGQILKEINDLTHQLEQLPPEKRPAAAPVDLVRRKYLAQLSANTGRAAIVYSTACLEPKPAPAENLMVALSDVQGFMEACSGVNERKLDLLITSPGGSPDAAESIMEYLRTQFDHIRAIIPVAAMSAATMMALAADEIVMGNQSQLGPIDPQFTLITPEGPRSSPGQAILDQFEKAKVECQNPANIGAWLPMLRALLPGLLAQCEAAQKLATELVKTSLEQHMFAGDPDATNKAQTAADWFSNFNFFKSHGRRVSSADARALELEVFDLEADQALQDVVLSIHHAVRHTYNRTPMVKLIENHNGRAYMEFTPQQPQLQIALPFGAPPGSPPKPPPQPPASPPPQQQP